jgi:hypothetical protein
MVKTTKKNIRERYGDNIIAVGDSAMQQLLKGRGADYFTEGIYGINARIYIIDDVAIVSGYRTFGADVDYRTVDAFERRAAELEWDDYDGHYALIKEFIARVLGE